MPQTCTRTRVGRKFEPHWIFPYQNKSDHLLFLEDIIFTYLYFISYSSINYHVYNQFCLQDLSENHGGEKVFLLIKIIIIYISLLSNMDKFMYDYYNTVSVMEKTITDMLVQDRNYIISFTCLCKNKCAPHHLSH